MLIPDITDWVSVAKQPRLQPDVQVFGLWVEAREPAEKSTQAPHRNALCPGINLVVC